jgi:large subunit ribosomal protein L1
MADNQQAESQASGTTTTPTPQETASLKRRKRPGVSPRLSKLIAEVRRKQREKIAKAGAVSVRQAIAMLKEYKAAINEARSKQKRKRKGFDETVEVHMSLGVDTTQSDQIVRGNVTLPHGIGKSVRVVVFCQGENIAKAKEAGADYAGSTDLIEKIQKDNWLDFDVALATQDLMGQVSRLGKVLGPRGLMPTPKAGTVVPLGQDIGQVVREFKAGKVEFRTDKGGNVHAGVGKLSFDEDKLVSNITTFVEQVRAAKPSGVRGNYVLSISVSTTQSPGILVSI